MPAASGTSLNNATVQVDGGYAPSGIGTIRKTIAFNAAVPTATAVAIGATLPSNAIILSGSGVYVTTAFNGTTPTLDIGYAADAGGAAAPAAFASALPVTTISFIPLDELLTATAAPRAVPSTLTARLNYTTTTLGSCELVINYAIG